MNSMMTSGNMSNHDLPLVDVNVTSFDREYLHWSLIIVEVGAVVVIVIGDISMLMMFFTRKLLGQSTNILVFSVAIGDLVTGLLTLPLAMLQKSRPGHFPAQTWHARTERERPRWETAEGGAS
ncbi:uncharacterized protein LOC118478868 isoform X2 [Aplysia californica]|uniref:Uncharacterized protein LOC118478868 isoform X2 n=1 Tax=Aplysia californica TaxID=6500 RepID=A0ABM1W3A2_APLCA|nr:uncharacterized protein LOC118478868 isoform X2 [Aplysia californica]